MVASYVPVGGFRCPITSQTVSSLHLSLSLPRLHPQKLTQPRKLTWRSPSQSHASAPADASHDAAQVRKEHGGPDRGGRLRALHLLHLLQPHPVSVPDGVLVPRDGVDACHRHHAQRPRRRLHDLQGTHGAVRADQVQRDLRLQLRRFHLQRPSRGAHGGVGADRDRAGGVQLGDDLEGLGGGRPRPRGRAFPAERPPGSAGADGHPGRPDQHPRSRRRRR
mmetsp:Transcript_35719/g.71642  ORF Transcript_35719/g.71642 Transcript_35719/m.71642 type:complete len:221 (+) Transcript_35719:308-970(+)